MSLDTQPRLQHVVVIGPSGSGKSTLARRLAAIIAGAFIELDGLYHQANWQHGDVEDFHARIREAMCGNDRWVADGNYRIARPVVWADADTAIWLDYSFARSFSRLVRRTARRRIRNEELWNGNRESLRSHFLSKDSLFWWAISTHWKHRRSYAEHFALYPDMRVIHFHSPRETEAWVHSLEHARTQKPAAH